jgi:hypothetical protein
MFIAAMLLLAASASVVAQETRTSDPVAILDRVLGFRQAWFGDYTPLAACSAFTVLGRPRDFPGKLSPSAVALLDRDVSACDKPPIQRFNAWCPIMQLLKVSIVGSAATLELRISRGEYNHRETYTVTRDSIFGWNVGQVKFSGFLQIEHGANPGDLGPNGPICPGRH